MIGDKAVRTNSRYEAQLPVTTPHTRMPQTAYYANQAQTTLPPPAPTKIISSHFAHLSNIRTVAHAKGYIESARISSHRQLWGKNQKKCKIESSLSIKGPFNVQCRFYPPVNRENFSAFLRHIKKKTQPTTLSSSDSLRQDPPPPWG